jgi:hypothetical protein
VKPIANVLNVKKERRQSSSHFNISKNRELQKLPLLKGVFQFSMLVTVCLAGTAYAAVPYLEVVGEMKLKLTERRK